MTKVTKKFAIQHNVESLTPEERTQYLRDASEFFGLDPDMNALDLIYMSDEYLGPKRLVVYARKGTTDILRGIKGITIVSVSQIDVPGTASFVAIGTDKAGRQEIAVGSSPIAGLTGERLASAVMTAQTRAMRRLTLQFVGGGLLDESEVNSQQAPTAPLAASAAALAGAPTVVPPPLGAPSSATGKDITKVEYPTESAFEKQQREMREEASRQLRQDKNPVIPTTETAITPAPAPVTTESEPTTEPAKVRKPRAPRKPKNTVSLDPAPTPEIVVPKVDPPTLCFDCGEILKDHQYVDGKGYICKPKVVLIATCPACGERAHEGRCSCLPKGSDALKPAPIGEEKAIGNGIRLLSPLAESSTVALTTDQFKDFRQRLRPYSNDILPKQGGMLPSEGIGGPSAKLAIFAAKSIGASSVEKLTVPQWEDLFDFLDTYNKDNGAKALVDYINTAIGAK